MLRVVVNLEEIIDGVNDSKTQPKKREILFDRLQQEAVNIGVELLVHRKLTYMA